MFFNNCPCKFKHFDEGQQYTNDYSCQPKQKCNLDCNHQSKPSQKRPCDCFMDFDECHIDNSRSECKFCIEGTIKFKNKCNMW